MFCFFVFFSVGINSYYNSIFSQADVECNFHVGEIVTALQKATLIPGGSESLVYTTLNGAIGMLVPFTSHEVRKFSDRYLG